MRIELVRKPVRTETCQNLTSKAVRIELVRKLVRTESGAPAQVSAGRLAPWLARKQGAGKQGAGKQRGKQAIGRFQGLDRAGYAPSVCSNTGSKLSRLSRRATLVAVPGRP